MPVYPGEMNSGTSSPSSARSRAARWRAARAQLPTPSRLASRSQARFSGEPVGLGDPLTHALLGLGAQPAAVCSAAAMIAPARSARVRPPGYRARADGEPAPRKPPSAS
jgi:hypothetical protein